jgi:NADPH:quinone reductase-like Zn-dependent oxidoreductase
MKAAVRSKYGPPSVLSISDIPIPQPKSDEVLIKIVATSVNRTDSGFLSGKPNFIRLFIGLFGPRNAVLGNEFAGEIIEIGSAVTDFKIGDKVFGYDGAQFGAQAEYKVMKVTGLISTMPAHLSYTTCAVLLEGAHYALSDINAAKIKKGSRVLVNGGTGGIGSAAVQLMAHIGAEVTAVCATPYIEKVKSLGATHVIDYLTTDFTTLPDTFDFVFDAVGKSSYWKCRKLLNKNGIYISTELGFMGQNPFLAMFMHYLPGKKIKFPLAFDDRDDMFTIKHLASIGAFQPLIDRTYTLDNIAEAYTYVNSGQKIGNVVITIS